MPIQPADPIQRRRVAIVLGVAALALLGLFVAFRYWLLHSVATLKNEQLLPAMHLVLGVCIASMTACLLLLGRHLLLRGRRIMRDRRYPANDARPLRDTPILEGDAAVRVGNASRMAGLIACLLGVAVAIAGWFWIAQFG